MDCFSNECIFKVNFDSDFGEDVRVCGNYSCVGCWDVSAAIPMVTTPDEHPWWRTLNAVNIRSDPKYLLYRYAIFRGGRFHRWEEVQPRRISNVWCMKGVVSTNDFVDRLDEDNAVENHDNPMHKKYHENTQQYGASYTPIDETDRVIIVSYFLPIKLHRNEEAQGGDGAWHFDRDPDHVASFTVPHASVVYVGSVRYQNKAIPPAERANVAALLGAHGLYPIFVEDELHTSFYDVFCKERQWRVLHEQVNVFGPLDDFLAQFDEAACGEMWRAYAQIMALFRAKVVEHYHTDELIWIHGYELMLLPSHVRRKIHLAKIGYFFHSPMHEYDMWVTMYRREDMIRGMLGANEIGFHTIEYARHFASACCRLLGYVYDVNKFGKLVLFVDQQEVVIASIHKGLDLPFIYSLNHSALFLTKTRAWRDKFPHKTIFGGFVNLGDQQKRSSIIFSEFDAFFLQNPCWLGHIVFTIIAVVPTLETSMVRRNRAEISSWVHVINAKHGTPDLVYYEERSEDDMPLMERFAYFAAADVMLLIKSPFGVLQYSLEYIIAKQKKLDFCAEQVKQGGRADQAQVKSDALDLSGRDVHSECHPRRLGLLILSRYLPAAKVLGGAIHIDTREKGAISGAIKYALNASDADIANRLYTNLTYAVNHTASTWAYHVLCDLKSSVQHIGKPNLVNATALGSQAFFKNVIGRFKALDTETLYRSYRKTNNRLIVINSESIPHLGQEERDVLDKISRDKKNLVFMVSAKSVNGIDEHFGKYKNLGLAAEHGFYFRWPSHKFSSANLALIQQSELATHWQSTLTPAETNWRHVVRPIMEMFTKNTLSSYIEEYEHSLIWQYANADPEFGYAQSKALEDYLLTLLPQHEISVRRGTNKTERYIEVHTRYVSKMSFLDNVVETLNSIHKRVDFLLLAGDDDSDELMFRRAVALDMPKVRENGKPAVFTCVIGKKNLSANCCVENVEEFMSILKKLAGSASREKRTYSTTDLEFLPVRTIGAESVENLRARSSSYTRWQDVNEPGWRGLTKMRSAPLLEMTETIQMQLKLDKIDQPSPSRNASRGTTSKGVLRTDPIPVEDHSISVEKYLDSLESKDGEDPPSF